MFTGSLGGPIKRDKLWFLVAARHQSSDEIIADVPVQIVAPDGEFINSYLDTYVRGPSLRLTWQAAPKHKLATFVQRWWKRKGKDFGAGQDPRASQFRDPKHAHHTVGNVKWTSPMTNRLLFEAGYSWTLFDWLGAPMPGLEQPRGTPLWYVKTRKTDTQRQVDDAVRVHGANSAGRLHDLGIEPDSAAGQHAPRVPGHDVVCHRIAQLQVRLQPRDRPGRPHGQHAQRRSLPELHRGQAELGRRLEHAGRGAGHRRLRRGALPAGLVDDQAADAESGTAHRVVQRGHESGIGAGRPVRAGAVLPGRARAAEVGTRLRAALRGGVRPVRRRPHGAEDQLQQVPPPVRRRPGRGLLADRHPQRAAQLVRLPAERGRHRLLRRSGRHQQRRHRRRTSRSVRARRRHVRHRLATTRSAISTGSTTGSSRRASSIS